MLRNVDVRVALGLEAVRTYEPGWSLRKPALSLCIEEYFAKYRIATLLLHMTVDGS